MHTKEKLKSKKKDQCSEIVAFFTLNEITKKAFHKNKKNHNDIEEGMFSILENFEEEE